MKRKARLEGHEFDLQDLAEWVSTGDIRVTKDDEGYCLEAADIDNPPEGKAYYEAAQEILSIVNGIGRVKSPQFRPVTLTGRYQEGENRHIVLAAVSGEIRFRGRAVGIGIDANGKVKPQPPPGDPDYAPLAWRRPEVAEVLDILGGPSVGWVELYKVFEIVDDSLKPTALRESGLATKNEISAFKASANRPEVGGASARHARMAGGPPQRTMSELEGRSFISRLVAAWMNTLA